MKKKILGRFKAQPETKWEMFRAHRENHTREVKNQLSDMARIELREDQVAVIRMRKYPINTLDLSLAQAVVQSFERVCNVPLVLHGRRKKRLSLRESFLST
eukprot:gene21014-7858_t